MLTKAKANFKPGDKEIIILENNLKTYLHLLRKELNNFLISKKYESEAKIAAAKRDKEVVAK